MKLEESAGFAKTTHAEKHLKITYNGAQFSEAVHLTHFNPMFHFCTPLKTSENLSFSGGIEIDHWTKMGFNTCIFTEKEFLDEYFFMIFTNILKLPFSLNAFQRWRPLFRHIKIKKP